MTKTYILFEHALGYALFRVKAKTIEDLLSIAEQLLADDEEFVKTFQLRAFLPFSSSASALQNCNGISEGIIPDELKDFLKEQLSASAFLCLADRKLAEAISLPNVGLPDTIICSAESKLLEVYRALRLKFPCYISQLSHFDESKAQIGLGHSYSRAKVKFNVNRNDNMIIQSINLLDQLEKDINTFCMRVKEWFSYHFPELTKIVPDNNTYVKVVAAIKTRDGATMQMIDELTEITDEETASNIISAASCSAGFDITEEDAENLALFMQKIVALFERKRLTSDYLCRKLDGVAPNLHTLIGEKVSARLIARAGSLTNLAKLPASTIQILGAEKALFRALRRRGNTPKYGLIYHSPFITRASKQNKGRISRFLAAKCAIASRIDSFSDNPCSIYGKHLKQQVEDRLNYFDTGEMPKTNIEAMAIAVAEAEKYIQKMKKKAIKTLNKANGSPLVNGAINGDLVDELKIKKKKKKRMDQELKKIEAEADDCVLVDDSLVLENSCEKKKKKKRHQSESILENSTETVTPSRKRTVSESSLSPCIAIDSVSPKKKKKNRLVA